MAVTGSGSVDECMISPAGFWARYDIVIVYYAEAAVQCTQ